MLMVLAALAIAGWSLAPMPQYSDWSVPVNLGPAINSAFNDSGPAISTDGLTLYFTSDRPGGSGGQDLWVARRPNPTTSWRSPINLGTRINSAFVDRNPALTADGRTMFFASERPGGSGDSDVWLTRRADENDDFAWEPPVNLGAVINTAAREAGPTYLQVEGGAHLYFVSIRRGRDGDIYVSPVDSNGSFGRPRLVGGVNSAWGDARPAIRQDGLEIFFQSFRPGSLGGCREQACFDLWLSRRATTRDAWSTPVSLGARVNSRFAETDAAISSDFRTLFFSSNRPGGYGRTDLYVTRRTLPDGL